MCIDGTAGVWLNSIILRIQIKLTSPERLWEDEGLGTTGILGPDTDGRSPWEESGNPLHGVLLHPS